MSGTNSKTFLVIGLGSMGKRRIRCLKALGYSDIIGFDIRTDRREEARNLYDIEVISILNKEAYRKVDTIIISTPPDLHLIYAKEALLYSLPVFVEASVILDDVKEIQKLNTKNLFIAPSATFFFHPIIKEIREIVKNKKYGKITNFTYHSGQYLPDWHPWENVNEFYVSKRETGGGREIVPFELTWLTKTLGFPKEIKGYFDKTIDFGAEIEDTYAFVMKFEHYLGSMIVDVAARFATRQLILNFEKAQLTWNWDDGYHRIFDVESKNWQIFKQSDEKHALGYNKNIVESMYIDEIKAFIEGVDNPEKFPNTIDEDIRVLELLNKIENSDGGF